MTIQGLGLVRFFLMFLKEVYFAHQGGIYLSSKNIKWIVHPKLKILSSFTHLQFVPNMKKNKNNNTM